MGQLTPNHILKVGKWFAFFFFKGHMPGTSANSIIMKGKTQCGSKNGKNIFTEETFDHQLNESKTQ